MMGAVSWGWGWGWRRSVKEHIQEDGGANFFRRRGHDRRLRRGTAAPAEQTEPGPSQHGGRGGGHEQGMVHLRGFDEAKLKVEQRQRDEGHGHVEGRAVGHAHQKAHGTGAGRGSGARRAEGEGGGRAGALSSGDGKRAAITTRQACRGGGGRKKREGQRPAPW